MNISDKYRITSQLGNKQNRKFGELYLGIELATNDAIVIKAVRKNVHSQLAIARINHEANFNFDFPGLPMIKDLYQSENEVMLIRKHVAGDTLDKVFSNLRRRQRIPFLIDLLEAMLPIFEHLKSRHIVHADIKPGNILVERSEEGINVGLIDFGLAIDRSNPDKRDTLFPLGYAAPELLLNQLDLVDQTTDIYALGVTLWKLFCEKIPLIHPNPSITTNLQLTHPLPDHPALPKGVYEILLKMCSKYQFSVPPNQLPSKEVREKLKEAQNLRYRNISEVIEDLKSIKPRKLFYQKRSLR
jgi:serine/threonine protein kinase